ncbi:XPG domain containing-domain-containing protein [Hypoxylon cercidicola]|nr:XPG domain containing-domain-containing protein [Hypoxylon cercidicola]
MGIRGFSQAVQRYGVFSSLSGDTVVIDGPALVHRISEACMRQRPLESGFVCHPPYSLLGRMVIGWLDELKNHNVNVRKIYFDGYLPPSKWDVRRERLLRQSLNMKALVSSEHFGSPRTPENAFCGLIKADMSLTRQVGRSSTDKLPKPPFMVPAVLEVLRNSEDWSDLVLVVPGEADMFCAQDVRENGGTLLTSDSDLLIQDLGPNGSVSFLWDVVPADPTSKELGMVACKISLNDVNSQLGLTNIGGLPRVAFEKQNSNMGFNAALQKARDSREDTLNSSEYQNFVEELKLKEYIPNNHPVLGILSSLDPRISEIVIQALLEKEAMSPASDPKTLRGPETLSMFLPVVVENRNRRSAWTASTNIRQITYSILQRLMHQKSSAVIEYRTLDPSTTLTGRQVEIPTPEETENDCAQLTTVLEKLAESLPSPDMRWLAFAVYQDIEWSMSEQRPSLSATLVHQAISQPEEAEEYSWDLIHFTAQFQACLYSLRMGKQILDAVLFLGRDLPASVRKLHDYLASFPLISEWPTVEHMFGMLSKFGNLKGLGIVTGVLGVPDIEPIELSMDSTESKKRRRGDHELLSRKGRPKDSKISPSVNPFAILSQASQD